MYSRKIRLLSLNMILVMLLTLIPAQARDEAEIDKNEKKIYTITLDGKDGTLGNENRITVNYSEDNPLSLGNYKFTRAGYTLVDWTKDENNDEWVADRNGIITVDLGYETLYAMWKADDYLEDNVSLVIGGEDKSDLLNSTTECSGTGWTYRSVDDTTSELHLSDGYNGGNIVCKRDNVNIVFDASVSTSQIEVSGALSLTANSTSAVVVSEDSCAIRAKSVAIANTGGIYRIVSNTKTAIEAESLYLASGNVSIEGNPAVSNSLPVTCEEGIAYRSNQNADGLMSGLYSYRKNMTVTLKGNGGTLDGMTEEKIVVYSEEEPLNLRNYPFTRDGYVLVGWVSDLNSMKYEAGADETLAKTGSYDTLYAVWLQVPKDGNYIIIQGSQYNGASASVKTSAGTFSSFDLPEDGKFTLPDLASVSTKNGATVWADRFTEEAYLSGETATLKPGAFLSGWWHSSDGTYVIFDGNGGTMTNTVNGVQHIVTRHLVGLRIGGTYYRETRIAKPGYMVISYNTKADGSGEFYPVSSFTVPESMKEATVLYAQWALLDQLKDGVRLIIDDDDMTGLLGKNGWSYGTGWEFRDNGEHGTADGQIVISDSTRYSGGSIAFDGNLTLGFVDGASVGQVEAAGRLALVSNASAGAQFSVKANGVAAIRAESVTTKGSAAVYHISAENAVAVDAATLFLDSPNVTIKGDPAVREGAVIDCMKGIGYTLSTDKKTLTTYAVEQKVTLNGNGGTLNGKEEMVVTYSPEKPLNLRDYPFAWKGYALVGWATDKEGTKLVTDATGHLKQLDDTTLYAVWLKVPDSNYVILLGSYDGAHATKAGFSSIAMAADGTVTLPEVKQNKMGLWRRSDTNEPYFPGETVKVPSGTRFNCVLYYNANKILIFDGNGGTMRDTVNGVQCTVTRRIVATAAGKTYYSRSQFVMDGYTMTGYNTKADGTGKSYPYDEFLVTEDMDNQTILYAQWEVSDPSEENITIDGLSYTARADHGGYNWSYAYNADNRRGYLFLKNYQGGSIASDIDLSVTSSGQSVVNGSISSKKSLWTEGGSTTSSLTVIASEGSALIAEEGLRLQHSDKLSATSENAPAVKVTGELYVNIGRNSFFEAAGAPCALSYGKMIKDRYQTYLIRGGTDKASAVPITDDTYKDKAYISYEMRERVLTLHGNGGKTAAGADTFTATSKDNTFDLGEYTNTFTNGGKRLLGWSKTENSATIDYVAASGTMYYFDWLYEFAADLYAVWEGEEQCGVVLKNYGYFDGDRYTYSEQYTAVAEGGIYTLPESSRAGYIFKGWLGSDGNSYAAGDTIKIPTALSFTAQYEVGKLTVGGVTYTANRVHGSDALGWMYYPDGYNGYYSGEAQMNLYKNYSSGPITLDGNLTLAVGTDLTGTDNLPAISVTGDMNIRIWGGGTLTPPKPTLTGGENAPAIKVGGTLHLGAPVTLIGGGDAPAMDVGVLDAECAFLAGESKETATRVGTYNDEHYVRMDLSDPVTFQVGDVAPDLPDTETYRSIGWSVTVDENNSRTTVWYLPGEEISGSEKTLTACYVPNDEGMIFLDGNGAVTAYGVRYSDAIVHLPSQAGWRYMNADELKAVFHRDGFELTGFVGPDPDSKTDKLYTLNDLDALSTVFDDGQLHMGKTTIYTAQWKRIGDKTEDSSAYYTKADDGTVKIESVDQAVLEEQLKKSGTVQIDLSKLKDAPRDVILPVSAVNNVLDLKVEALSIKMADAVVTLDKTAMQSVIEMANGADIQLHVSTGDALNEGQTAIIGDIEQGMVLDVSLTANGTEIHNFDGKVTISVPFTWTKQGVLQAWYLADGNKKEAIDVAYRDGNAVLTLSHFSTYAVTVTDAPNDTIVRVGATSVTVNAPEGDSCVAALFSADGRQLAVGQAPVNKEGKTTVTWGAVNSAEVLTLKLFWLDKNGAPSGRTPPVLVKMSAR